MLYGISVHGTRIRAYPEALAICPSCKELLVPKCGVINIWHWAHRNTSDCDSWAEGETEWHLGWKELAENTEVVMGPHRADIVAANGTVIELQHSSISVPEIKERQQFYRRMVWVFDVREPYEKERFTFRMENNVAKFRWRYPRKSIASARNIYLDLGPVLLEVKKQYERMWAGWGYLLTKEEFCESYKLNSPT